MQCEVTTVATYSGQPFVHQPKDLNRDWSPRFSTLRDKNCYRHGGRQLASPRDLGVVDLARGVRVDVGREQQRSSGQKRQCACGRHLELMLGAPAVRRKLQRRRAMKQSRLRCDFGGPGIYKRRQHIFANDIISRIVAIGVMNDA
jgi:hypothetical protein